MSPATLPSDSAVFRAAPISAAPDRRQEHRASIECDLWMVGHEGGTVLRCHCDNASETGLHLIAPLGYGIARGQHYELRSHLPGHEPLPGFDFSKSRRARVVHTEILFVSNGDRLGVGVELEPE